MAYDLTRTTSGLIQLIDCEATTGWTEESGDKATISAVSDYKKHGSNSIKLNQDSVGLGFWSYIHSGQTGTYWVSCWIRPTGTGIEMTFGCADGDASVSTNEGVFLRFDNDTKFKYYDGSYHDLIDPFAAQWYLCMIKIDVSADTFDLWVDGASEGTGLGFRSSIAEADRFYISGYAVTGDMSRTDEVAIFTDNTITMTGLSTGQKFKLYDRSDSLVGTSDAANGSDATLDIETYASDGCPFRNFVVTDTDGSTTLYTMPSGHDQYDAIYGGDTFNFSTVPTIKPVAGNIVSTMNVLGMI